MTHSILVIEDDKLLNRLVTNRLIELGYQVASAVSWGEAERHLARQEPKLILMDVQLPDANGLEVLVKLTGEYPVVMLTAYGSVKDAVKAMKTGAAEYLVKPLSLEELELTIARTIEAVELREDHQFCKRRLALRDRRKKMVGKSESLSSLYNLIDAVAPSEMTVLAQGESGVGKELVAQAIHERSMRAAKNFVVVDCCSLQKHLFETELFGHERGAFTGADRQKRGLIENADGGSLFLDEIGEIEPAIQAKLLRILETGQFRRVGGTKDLTANVRVVAATNRNLEQMSREGKFRADLFYRLSAFVLQIPPLRDRKADIPDLVRHFISHHSFSRRIDKKVTSETMHLLTQYDWPGNIRELKNVVERAIILSLDSPRILPGHLAFSGALKIPQIDGSKGRVTLSFDHEPSLSEIEKMYLGTLLERHEGRRAVIAKTLGVSERNVYRMLDRYDFKNRKADSVSG
ncbi:MAG: sigma-54 dependent transcriptional regulator [Pseudomonadota bacterium]|nr:sigma-54 dependent transcriptional regulator [Pseudomonadota bacterium]